MSADVMTIGPLAAAAGVSRKAIRVWIDRGLLTAHDRTATGYQLFTQDAVERAQFICRARSLGLSLAHIQQILRAGDDGTGTPCTRVRRMFHERITAIDTTIADLLALRATLQAACAEPPEDARHATVCPIIERTDARGAIGDIVIPLTRRAAAARSGRSAG